MQSQAGVKLYPSERIHGQVIRARAPLRISFAGGGTDVSPYAEEFGGAVLNVTIDKYAYVSLEACEGTRFLVRDLDEGTEVAGDVGTRQTYDGRYDLAKAVINALNVEKGFRLTLMSEAPWGSGLGSSSTHVVAVLGAFSHWLRLGLGSYELAELAYRIERQDMGLAGGRQDQYSATFGGFNFMEFGGRGTVVTPLRVKPSIVNELHYRSLMCFLGRTRRSSQILEDQIDRFKTNQPDSVGAMHRTKELAFEMKRALLTGNIDDMASLLDEGWQQKRLFSGLISNAAIDDMYAQAKERGAIGGKVLGAGGGGHMLFICSADGKKPLAKYLAAQGFAVAPFAFDMAGLVTWEVTNAW